MKYFLVSLLSFLFTIDIIAQSISKVEAVEYLVNSYPEGQLSDVYKSFYQDNFGPGHLLGDTLAAKNYFMEELKDSTQWGGPVYEFTGEGKNFVRLNMDLVRKGIIPAEEYFKAFQNSLGRVNKPTDDYWLNYWLEIDDIIKRKNLHFINEEKDRIMIDEKLRSKNFPIHHSENFNQQYNFHYRIISLPEFEALHKRYLNGN